MGGIEQRALANAAMNRYADGEEAAFSELYDVLSPMLMSFLLRQTGQVAKAEDLLQQTFLNVHHARGCFLRGAQVLPWVFAIARRLVIDGSRKRSEEALSDHDPLDAGQHGGDAHVHAAQLAKRANAALEKMPESQRVAFQLLRVEGLSHLEAAEVLGVTVSAVKLRAHRAYEALRAALGDEADQMGVEEAGLKSASG